MNCCGNCNHWDQFENVDGKLGIGECSSLVPKYVERLIKNHKNQFPDLKVMESEDGEGCEMWEKR